MRGVYNFSLHKLGFVAVERFTVFALLDANGWVLPAMFAVACYGVLVDVYKPCHTFTLLHRRISFRRRRVDQKIVRHHAYGLPSTYNLYRLPILIFIRGDRT